MMKINTISQNLKKTTLVVLMLSSSAICHAGTMGPVSSQPTYIPYITGEASYTWPNIGAVQINGYPASLDLNGWGGRLGLGMAYASPIENIHFTAEIGGGYYGNTNHSLSTSVNAKSNIDGYDVLAGALYKTTYNVDLFGQIGFMLQNDRISANQNIAYVVPGGSYALNSSRKYVSSQVLPEVKIGGIYNLTQNWGVSAAYMGVFGSRPGANLNYGIVGTEQFLTQTINTQNPTLNSVMFGLRYSIV